MRASTDVSTDWLPGWYGGGTGSVLTVAAASDASGVDIVVARGARISGTVTGAGAQGQPSRPAASAYVTLYRLEDDYAIASDYTDAAGAYSFGKLEAGTYHVAVQPSGSSPWLTQWYTGAATRVGATGITVATGEALAGRDVELARGGTLQGVVTGAGAPVPYVSVRIYDAATGVRVTSTTTAIDGSYSVGGLDSGEYLVRFLPSDRSGNWNDEWSANRRHEADR